MTNAGRLQGGDAQPTESAEPDWSDQIANALGTHRSVNSSMAGRKRFRAFMFRPFTSTPVRQCARIDTQVPSDLGDRFTGRPDDPHRPLTELRIELPSCFWHDCSS